tara:strand:+ start:310 stop:429 length:120 start_codon:yes stop_codon:yes gene_type:complete
VVEELGSLWIGVWIVYKEKEEKGKRGTNGRGERKERLVV